MANRTATLKLSVSYPDEQGSTRIPSLSLPIKFAPSGGCFVGAIDVPEDTADCTTFENILEGLSISKVTGLVFQNNTTNDVKFRTNGNDSGHVGVGGIRVVGEKELPANCPVSSISFQTKGAQSAAGSLLLWVWGDPIDES